MPSAILGTGPKRRLPATNSRIITAGDKPANRLMPNSMTTRSEPIGRNASTRNSSMPQRTLRLTPKPAIISITTASMPSSVPSSMLDSKPSNNSFVSCPGIRCRFLRPVRGTLVPRIPSFYLSITRYINLSISRKNPKYAYSCLNLPTVAYSGIFSSFPLAYLEKKQYLCTRNAVIGHTWTIPSSQRHIEITSITIIRIQKSVGNYFE